MLSRDLLHGARSLAKAPGFTLAAVLTLAIGVGGNAAIFGAAEAIFLRPLPYPNGDRLVFVSSSFPGNAVGGDNFSVPDFVDLERESASFEALAAYYDWTGVALASAGEEPVRLTSNFVSAGYFEMFEARAELGRLVDASENRLPAAEPVAVLSHACWQRQFGGDPGVVGRAVLLNEVPVTVVGVMDRRFRDIEETWRPEVDVWMPLALSDRLLRQSAMESRDRRLFYGVGRLRPGVEPGAAHEEASALAARLAAAHPETNRGFDLHVRPLRDHFVGGLYGPALLLVAGAAFLLLICCANVASLLLVRVGGRRRELAVRAALGASRARLVRELLVECVLLSAAGGLCGLLVALWAVDLLSTWDAIELPPFLEIGVNRWVLAAGVLFASATALLFGVLPGLSGSRVDIRDALGKGSRASAGGRGLERKLLTVAEVGLALTLLAGAGLTARSFMKLAATDVGFDAENLLTARVELRGDRYAEEAARARFGRALVEAAGEAPGVRTATIWGPGDLGHATWVMFVAPEGREGRGEDDYVMTHTHRTNPGGLADLGIPLARGRDFTWDDALGAAPVAIVSQSVADAFWPGEDPVGKRLLWQGRDARPTVVGVAADVTHRERFSPEHGAVALRPQLDVYMPYMQTPLRSIVLAARTSGDAARAERGLRAALLALDPTVPLYDVRPVEDRLRAQEGPSRAIATLMVVYAATALLLAAIGIYGVLSQAVGQRTRELGIRIALGADRGTILRMVLGQGLTLVLAGIAVGLGASLALGRLLASMLFGVSPSDPAVLAVISAVLAAVALAACLLPALRATRVDPISALRCE